MDNRFGAIGVVEGGALAGRQFLIPAVVYVERGKGPDGQTQYARACLRHHKFIPDQGCQECLTEMAAEAEKNKQLGL